jgi:hypothetical protein
MIDIYTKLYGVRVQKTNIHIYRHANTNVTESNLLLNAVSQGLLIIGHAHLQAEPIYNETVQHTENVLGSLALVVFINFRLLDSALFGIKAFPIQEGKKMKE